jgi:hypothetical protein
MGILCQGCRFGLLEIKGLTPDRLPWEGYGKEEASSFKPLTLATRRGWLAGSIGICRCGCAPC